MGEIKREVLAMKVNLKKIIEGLFMFFLLIFILIATILGRNYTQKGNIFNISFMIFIFIVLVLLALIYYQLTLKIGKTTFLEYNDQSVILKDFGIALTSGGFITVATSNEAVTGSGIVLGGLVCLILSEVFRTKSEVAERNHKKLIEKKL